LETQTLPFVDPYNLAEELDELLPVSLVRFKATGDLWWFRQGLALLARWWVQNHFHIPLLQETLGLIKDKKPKQGSQVLMPRSHKNLVPLQVRGNFLWCESNSRCAILALRQGLDIEQRQWFMDERKKDIEHLVEDLEVFDCLEDMIRLSHKQSIQA
jgi:hypothetical protein